MEFDRLHKLSEKREQYTQRADMCKSEYSETKRKFSGDVLRLSLKGINMKNKFSKKAKKRYSLQYKCMKTQKGWMSPPSSDR